MGELKLLSKVIDTIEDDTLRLKLEETLMREANATE